ncbi:Hypothetical predicted protein [Podarcis lilfordi]|uniref:4Fe-4S ferredoxin-type domain-containing protein n=1 Tax=Podarcis lilfordi TaxID=74358 RepID=A0AA35P432_9SAUR|nr:Hypothetical predicted protein [Podarcis lilfordi]
MLANLLDAIPNSCHLLLLLVVVLLLLFAGNWAAENVRISWVPPCLKKKQTKHPAAWITPLEGARDISTDTEVRWNTSTESGKRSCETLSLHRTLHTLDKNIQYLAWQMQRISGTISRTPSNVSMGSVTSICSWGHSSGGGGGDIEEEEVEVDTTCYSWSAVPPSLAPTSLNKAAAAPAAHLPKPPRVVCHQPPHQPHPCPKQDSSLYQKRLQGQWGSTTPCSDSTTRRICTPPPWHPTNKHPSGPAHPPKPSNRIGFLDYKSQELLNWHVHTKQRQKEEDAVLAMLSRRDPSPKGRAWLVSLEAPKGGVPQWPAGPQLPTGQRSRSRTPPQPHPAGRQSPPKTLHVRSPCPRPPTPPREELLTPPILVCKTVSHSSLRSLATGEVGSEAAKEGLETLLGLFGPGKSPLAKELSRPGTPKEKERDVGGSRRPHSNPKETRAASPKARAASPKARAASPKAKPLEIEISATLDRKVRRLSWADATAPEAPRPLAIRDMMSTTRPPVLDPLFMCQAQLEMPCLALGPAKVQQEVCQPAVPPGKTPCLAHALVESLDQDQAVQDLHQALAKGLGKGRGRPCVEYPVCLLCGRCTPYCPHPPTRYSPSLVVYPRLSVREGEVHMGLGFLLKIKRSEANEWGLVCKPDASRTRPGKEGLPSKLDRSKGKRRKNKAAAPQPRDPEKVVRLHRQQSAERLDMRPKNHGRSVPKPVPPPKRKPEPELRMPAPSTVLAVPPKKRPNILKRLLLCIKNVWAKVRGKPVKPPKRQGSPPALPKSPERPWSPSSSPDDSKPPNHEGILLHRQDSLLTNINALEPSPRQSSRRVSLQLGTPKAPRSPQKSGALKKLSRQPSPVQFKKASSKQKSHRSSAP